jgi:RNA recognition motif-containing protein
MNFDIPISLPIAARVVTDRVTGFSKGFGFVRYATTEEAAKGIEGMDGKVYGCLMLSVYFIFH